jgi:hypothetical protein
MMIMPCDDDSSWFLSVEVTAVTRTLPWQGAFPLHVAAGFGQTDAVRCLLRLGADINVVDHTVRGGPNPAPSVLRRTVVSRPRG